MKKFLSILAIALAFLATACSSNDIYDDMPRAIQEFISQYYPNSQLESFTYVGNHYTAIIKNGPTMVFNNQGSWTKVDGNGSILPQALLFNDLPPALYSYLQETENTNSVFMIDRNNTTYHVQLLVYTLTYDIASGQITGKD